MTHLNSPSDEATSATTPTPGADHERLLDAFLDDHAEWQRWRTWSDETTHAVHQSMLLRAELIHEPSAGDVRWRFAVYSSPVGARLWHAAACSSTPTEVIRALLLSLATHAAEYPHIHHPDHDVPVEAPQPLADSGWIRVAEAARGGIRWSPANDAFVLRHTVADRGADSPAAWVLSGLDQHHQRWTIALSSMTPAAALTAVSEALADSEALLRQRNTTPFVAHNRPHPGPPPHGRRAR
ncbi:DUF317 domain-containing protein [Streptomyces rubiginosohelvolus]|uniref:DUF317 domain-containing protein n=1 Tax=Streptomyces rubiginosohelvolus TaxID=67362 RepID=UPI0035D775D5